MRVCTINDLLWWDALCKVLWVIILDNFQLKSNLRDVPLVVLSLKVCVVYLLPEVQLCTSTSIVVEPWSTGLFFW